MSQIKTEHAGHEITYSENGDVWRCWSLDLEAKTLSALKTKINKHDADTRRVDNVRAWFLQYSGPERCVVTLIEGNGAWISILDKRATRKRQREALDKLILDTPENSAALDRWRKLTRAAREASQAASAALEAIPRVTLEALKSAGTKSEAA